jgi:hypothetical protein
LGRKECQHGARGDFLPALEQAKSQLLRQMPILWCSHLTFVQIPCILAMNSFFHHKWKNARAPIFYRH